MALLSGIVRLMFIRASSAGAVDHHYWILAARAYRDQRGFPVRIEGKYLLEDERQTYPPGFGLFLALFPETLLRGPGSVWIVVAVDVATLGGTRRGGRGARIGCVGPCRTGCRLRACACPRCLQHAAHLTRPWQFFPGGETPRGAGGGRERRPRSCGVVARCRRRDSIRDPTHKMTTQFMLALWPVWALALGSPVAASGPALRSRPGIAADRRRLSAPAMVGPCRDRRILESQLAIPRRPRVSPITDIRRSIEAGAGRIPSTGAWRNPPPYRSGGRLSSCRLVLASDAFFCARAAPLARGLASDGPCNHAGHIARTASQVPGRRAALPVQRRRTGGAVVGAPSIEPDRTGPDAVSGRRDRDRRKPRARLAQANAAPRERSRLIRFGGGSFAGFARDARRCLSRHCRRTHRRRNPSRCVLGRARTGIP